MQDVLHILTKYRSKGIRISLDEKGLNLSIKGNVAALDDFDKQTLRDNKEALLNFLKKQEVTRISSTDVADGQRLSLSPNQKSIWLHAQMEENNTMYLIPSVYQLKIAELNKEHLISAVQDLVREHRILSFVFEVSEGEPFQYPTDFDVSRHIFFNELSHVSAEEKIPTCEKAVQESMQVGFDITTQPPWSITVFSFGDDSYSLFVKIHHLIADGTTLSLFFDNLFEAYRSRSAGTTLHHSGIQYHDYLNWISNREFQKQSSNFWKSYLNNRPDDFQFVLKQEIQEVSVSPITELKLHAAFSSEIELFAKRNAVSVSHLYSFAFGFVLSKHGRTNDVIMGTPAEGRSSSELTRVIGNLVNTLPIRLQLNYANSLIENIQTFGKGFLSILEHQLYPLEYLLEDIKYERRQDTFPLFSAMVSFPNNNELGARNENELKISKDKALYDLTLTVLQLQNETDLQIEFDPNKFTNGFVCSLLDQVLVVLRQIISKPNLSLAQVSLLGERDRQARLLAGIPHMEHESKFESVMEVVAVKVLEKSDAAAVIEDGKPTSYFELNQRAKSIASKLQNRGIKEGDRVIVELPAGANLISAMLGIWMAGGVYVPLGTQLPAIRKQEIIDNCEARISIDDDFFSNLVFAEPVSKTLSREQCAYILYTSGSTGKPKGVVISHGAIASKMEEELKLIHLETITTLTLTSPTFDVSFLELLLPLLNGGSVVIEKDKSNNSVFQLIHENQVTVLQGTPTYFSHFESELDGHQASVLNETLKLLCIGGESLNDSLVQRLKKKLPKVQINNHYGPTEITIDALVKTDVNTFKQNSLGSALAFTGAFVVDEFGNVLPNNVAGELWISGPSLAVGYWNLETDSAEKFIESETLKRRVYKTGDLTAWLPNGEIQFIGRKDKQVKFRGFRIELEEINCRLRELDGFSDAYTAVSQNVLIGWVVVDHKNRLESVHQMLKSTLPEYMIPTVFEQVHAIPMTVNGKVDEKQLPYPQVLRVGFVAPRNEVELQLVEIWQVILGIESVGVNDNFFELGGHSLKITQLASRYQKSFGTQLSIKDLFAHSTISSHAELIEKGSKNQVNRPVLRVDEAVDYPVSYAQQRMWVLSQIDEGSRAYHMPTAMRLKGELEVEKFVQSIESVIDRHESLRTVFITNDNGDLRQKIRTREQLNFQVDLRDLTDVDDQESFIYEFATEKTEASFELSTGPLVRVGLLILSHNEYFFYYNMHHIISDGWSMEVLAKDVLSTYAALVKNEPLEAALPIQYKDYAAWQIQQIEYELGVESKNYWLKKFEGELPVLDLPSQKLRPAIKTYNGATLDFSFTKELSGVLISFCQKEGGTLFTGLLAGLNGILSRYTNQEDIIIGTPIAGRTAVELESQIGLYVNTLALRTQFSSSDDFATLFHKVKQTTLGAFDHQIYPFDKLVNELDLVRDTSRNPLFDVMLVMQNTSTEQNSSDKTSVNAFVEVVPEVPGGSVSRFDITFTFLETNGMLFGSVEYNTDIYTSDFISQLTNHFQGFIEAALKVEAMPISEVSYMNSDEINRLLYSFNDTQVEYPKDKTIIHLFEEQVEKTPNDIAVIFEDKTLTYKELNEESNRLSHYLRSEYEISPDDLIAVKLERSEKMIIVLLGILKSGAAYVPIDLSYPDERINYILEDSQAKITIDSNELDVFFTKQVAFSAANPEKINAPNDLAYIIYTSGTTGNPKGVMITHSNAVSLILWAISEFDTTKFDIVFAATSYCFDLSIFEIFYSLSAGKKIRVLKNATEIKDWIDKDKNSLINTVPSVVRTLIEENCSFENVGVLNMAGEALTPDIVSQLPLNHLDAYNLYGPSEDTTYSTFQLLKNVDEPSIPIGKPISNTQIYVLDETLNLVPVGGIGTIYISGEGLSRGYLNKPELTAEKFISNPFHSGATMYNSGDYGRWLLDGTIEYVGRKDFQVKIRGYRIELGEIEAALMQYSTKISQVVVDAKTINNENTLVAYCISEEEVDQLSIRSYLQERLPNYMIPSIYVSLESFPLNHNGKIDRSALLKIHTEGVSNSIFVAPTTEIEAQVIAIWEEVLALKRIGLTDNFFELGGHSLKITQLLSRYQKTFSVQLNMTDLFLNTTPKSHSELIENSSIKTTEAKIIPVAEADDYAVSFAQQRLWILSQSEDGSSAYNMPFAVKITGSLNTERFIQAIHKLVERHEILRTVFIQSEEGLRQKVKSRENLRFQVELVDHLGKDEGVTKNYLAQKSADVFDLEHGPLIKASLIKTKEDECVFFYSLHHSICDGWSLEVIANEVFENYSGHADLKTLPIQYKDYSHWQNERIKDNSEDERYWLQQFEGEIPVLDMPFPKARPTVKTFNGRVLEFNFSRENSRKLKAYCKENNGTMFMGLLAGLTAVLSRYTHQKEIVIGTPIAGRDQVALEKQIGMYANTLALKNAINEGATFQDVFNEVQTSTLSAFNHSRYPFDKLVDKLRIQHDPSRNPLFDVMLLMNATSNQVKNERSDHENLEVSHFETHFSKAHFDLLISFSEHTDQLIGAVEFNTDIYEDDFIRQLMKHYETLLIKAIDQKQTPVSKVNYLSETETENLLFGLNDTSCEYPKNKTVIDLIDEQTIISHDSVALVFEDKSFTYGELNEISNKLAVYIGEKYNILPDDLVSIELERSQWSIISMVAILKAGAVYVPIDLEYPEDRIQRMVDDSRCRLRIKADVIEDFTANFEGIDISNFQQKSTPEGLAYIIYTSGSTGTPKGVMMPHRAMMNLVSFHKKLDISTKRVTQFTSFSFDVSFQEVFSTLGLGGALYVLSSEVRKDPDALVHYLRTHSITSVYLPTSYFKFLSGECLVDEVPELKDIIVAGEQLTISPQMREMIAKNSLQLHNHYGPAETHVVTTLTLDGDALQTTDVPTIGKPIQNTQLYVLDENMGLVPQGINGMIYIGGDAVSNGYLNQGEMTKEKFVSSPFQKGHTLYKTGDLAKWLPNGELSFLGRNDDQLKIRGYRVEPGEIETHIRNYSDAVREVVVILNEFEGEKVLAAYYVAGLDVDKKELMDFLKQKIQEYMVPRFFVQVDGISLNANGKIDRKKLPVLSEEFSVKREYKAPRNEMEEKMVAIWKDVLGIERIGIQDNFFELGGNSIMVTRVVNRIEKEFNKKATFKQVFSHPTCLELMECLNEEQELIPVIKHKFIADQANPLSENQKRLWIVHHENPESDAYNIDVGMYLEGELQLNHFIDSFQAVVNRHESFRTEFILSEEGLPEQRVREDVAANVLFERRDEEPTDARLITILNQESKTIFDLTAAPLAKFKIIEFSNGNYFVVIVMHHIVTDGWSLEILINEFINIYNSKIHTNSLPHPTDFTYRDYTLWQQQNMLSEHYLDGLNYWKQRFDSEVPFLKLSKQGADEINPKHNSAGLVQFEISNETRVKLEALTKKHQVSMYSLLFVAFTTLLNHISGQNQIVLGTSVSGRVKKEFEAIIGFFINTLPLKVSFNPERSFIELLLESHANILSDIDHQDISLDEIVRVSQATDLFQGRFVLNQNVQNINDKLSMEGIKTIKKFDAQDGDAKFNFSLILNANEHSLMGVFEYKSALYDEGYMTLISEEYTRLLDNIKSEEDQSVQSLNSFNTNYAQYLKNKTQSASNKLFENLKSFTHEK